MTEPKLGWQTEEEIPRKGEKLEIVVHETRWRRAVRYISAALGGKE